jgi:methylenetetrahydrofolate dehydrogenase (NADP+)/methenyltetrahydrofolate cyclohydrolase
MPAKIIDGKAIAEKVRSELKEKIAKSSGKPGLAIVQVGDNPVSAVYIHKKMIAGNDVGIHMEHVHLPADTHEAELLSAIDKLNQRNDIHGMIVQLPIPEHLDDFLVLDAILPHKDVDGFHPMNVGSLVIGKPRFIPATAKGVMKLIESTGEKLAGRHAVVVGRSNIVGKPTAYLLLQKHCTVTICHRYTAELAKYTKQADVLVVAAGVPKLVTGGMIKPGAIVIDVGTSKTPDGKLVGDVDFETAKDVAGWITPVPGGVGPMTVAMLLENTYEAMVDNPLKPKYE